MSSQSPPFAAPLSAVSSQYNKLRDFSVESQRQMFIQEQEKERKAAELRRSSRKIMKASSQSSMVTANVLLSGLMSHLESGNEGGFASHKTRVGEDDDDSIVDDWSLDSEESFYVGIERADYTQPDNYEMYGQEEKQDSLECKEDRLGISRVSAAIIHREMGTNWDEDINPVYEQSKSLYQLMTGNFDSKLGAKKCMKDKLVAMPLEVKGICYTPRDHLGVEQDASNKVYQREAAEGKMLINILTSSTSASI